MRDKYIELIINYIKEKPGYEQALDDIKKEVLALGANEAEFDEAIRRITGVTPHTNPQTQITEQFITQNTIQPDYTNTKEPKIVKKLLELAVGKKNIKLNKKYVAVIAFVFIFAIIALGAVNFNSKPKNALVAKTQTQPSNDNGIVPIVYASSQPVDADKIFSIKSKNVTLTVSGKPKKEVLGFFPYWMMSKYNEIPLNTLTSISLFGLDVNAGGNIVTQGSDEASGGWAMWKDPNLDNLISKARSYGLKVTLTIKSFNSADIDALANSDNAQKNLISTVSYLVSSKNLDGVNVDFEYVGNPSSQTRDGFTRLITNLNSELKRQNSNATLTVDTYLASGSDNGIFNISALALNCDEFVIMGYDMHTPNGDAGPIAAMGGDTNIIGYIQNYLEKVDPSKLILAVPYYGYDWPQQKGAGSVKILPYAQIAEMDQNVKLNWDDVSQTPSFSYKDDTGTARTVYFDNVRSLGIKYDFINKKNLRGVGIWALGYDGNNQDLEKLLIDKFINL